MTAVARADITEHEGHAIEDESVDAPPGDTIWHNPTSRDVVVPIWVGTSHLIGKKFKPGPDGKVRRPTGIRRYVIPAGGERAIPSEFDSAVQVVQDNMIVAGLAPQLKRKGVQDAPKLHYALDELEARRKAEHDRAVAATLAKAAANEALLVAQANAEAADAEAAAREASTEKTKTAGETATTKQTPKGK
jgi:hypothetical protein